MNAKAIVILAAVLLAACAQEEPPPEKKAPVGRAETRAIRNTDAVGYSGSQIADKVDAGLNAQEEANRRNQEAADKASE
ncbi:MAG TPA: hypothetical protein VM240_07155 [Verrucomicrobiae bacterium]|nr:hypothetical protein [Verrucomicrobiae bacterium]